MIRFPFVSDMSMKVYIFATSLLLFVDDFVFISCRMAAVRNNVMSVNLWQACIIAVTVTITSQVGRAHPVMNVDPCLSSLHMWMGRTFAVCSRYTPVLILIKSICCLYEC